MSFSKKSAKKYRKMVKEYLGMDKGTAMNRLRKILLFELSKKAGMDRCHRCKLLITDIAEFSVEHIKPWLWRDVKLFWDINNIAFSHLVCNSSTSKVKKGCGSYARYKNGCRCPACYEKYKECTKKHRDTRYKKIVAVKKLKNFSTNKEVNAYLIEMKKKYGFTEIQQLIDKLKEEQNEHN